MNAPEPDFEAHARGTREPPLVLVVDDERRSQEAMRRTLDEDFRVLTAGDADAALALMERHHVDVVLCDQRMPGTTGVDFFKQARERWPDVVRILVSGYTDSQDIIAGVNDAGIFQYLLKPWQPEQDGERLVLKKRWNVRNSVPHHHPDAEQQQADAQLPKVPLPARTELEPVAGCEPEWGSVDGKDYRFISQEAFIAERDQGHFLEWAEVHGHFYGTSKPWPRAYLVCKFSLIDYLSRSSPCLGSFSRW